MYKSKRICSLHFDQSSYISNELLRKDSFPTLQLPTLQTLPDSDDEGRFIQDTSQFKGENGNLY